MGANIFFGEKGVRRGAITCPLPRPHFVQF